MAGRVTQLVVEAVIAATDANVRVTQVAVEAVIAPTDAVVRTTQIAVEAVVSPTSQNLVVSQAGIEVARTGDNPNVLVSQAGIEVAYELPKGSFISRAVVLGPVSSSFAASAVIRTTASSSTTVDALRLKTFTFERWVEGGWTDPFYDHVGFTLDAVRIPGFFVNAFINIDFMPFWTVDATILATITFGPRADAVLFAEMSGSFAVNAVFRWTVASTWTVDATIRKVTAATFPANAVKLKAIPGSTTARAALFATLEASFTLEAVKSTWFSLDAFIPISVNAWLDLGFFANAVIKATIGVPAFQPLVFPGTSQTLHGLTANALTPLVAIGEGELLIVRVVTPPSDGGDLGAFNTTLTLNYGITADPGEYALTVLPGQYYVYSSRGNVYRPGLTGSGSYSSWAVSTLQITVDAFVQPVFRVDAAIVWHFEFTATADSWLKRTWLKTFSVGAFVEPWFLLDASIVPMHFHASAWIRTDFHVDAWIIRRVTGSFTVNAFRQPSFRVNAVKRRTQAKTFTVAAWKTNPVYGNFNANAMVGFYLTANAAIKLVKYRRYTANAVKKGPVQGPGYSVDAFVRTYFRVDAFIFRQEFFLSAVIHKPGEYIDPVKGFTANAALVWHWVVATSADAFIQPYFRAGAIQLRVQDGSKAVDAAIVWRIYGDFTLQAGITGFQTDAVIFRPDMGGVFTFYAWKIESIPQKTFLVQAEKYDPGAYWDPEWEVWLHQHFLADAAIVRRPITSFGVDSSFAVAGLGMYGFHADARIHAPEITSGFWIEATIDAQKTVIYEGDGYTDQVLTTFTERLTFPGWTDTTWGGTNRISSRFFSAQGERVTFTIWDWPNADSVGIISVNENLYASENGGHSAQGQVEFDGNAVSFLPTYWEEEHYAYGWTESRVYEPLMAGDMMMSYKRWMTVVYSRPAPTLDAFLVGTNGDPFTLDAEIVGLTKDRTFSVDAEMSGAGERRGQIAIDAEILASVSLSWRLDATFGAMYFTVEAAIYQPNATIDAFIQPYFRVDAIVLYTRKWVSGLPPIDAVIVRPTRTGSFVAGADISPVDQVRGLIGIDALVLADRGWRIYLAAQIVGQVLGMAVDAYIAQRMTVDAYIQPSFTVSAHIRGNSYIIFPEDGGEPTDPLGGPPPINRRFRVKIEAFIPDEIPVGNDAEIERLITLILEAEMELEAMMCAYTHYSSQDASTVGYAPNDGGTGRTSTLPGALSQVGYPGAGDIDDCWAVATIWSANAAGYSYRPNMSVFRAAAKNPDRPGPTGGTLDHVMRGAQGCYPGAHIRRYHSWNWDGFISMLKAGWVASLAIRSSALPSDYQYGFHGGHQVGVAYQNGAYFIMNPLQSNGSRPREISGSDLRKAARAFTGGNISACLFS